MTSLHELIKNEDHEKILELESGKHKCIALIKLKRFKEALEHCDPISYESAYVFYSLKKYKRALKVLNELDNSQEKVKILKSQVLYYLSRYNEAYTLLSECTLSEEMIINLTAMRSLAELAHSTTKQIGSKYSVKKKDEMAKFIDFDKNKFSDKELEEEYFYNESFKYLNDEKKFVSVLKNHTNKFTGIIKDQFNNVIGNLDEINEENLSKGKKKTLKFNKKEINDLKNKIHFQKGILQSDEKYWPNNEYFCFTKAHKLNYDLQDEVIPSDSPNLLLLNAFVNLKRMIKGNKFTRKYFNIPYESFIWEIVRILSLRKKEFLEENEKIKEILKKINE